MQIPSSRSVHIWVSISLALPILIVAVTAIFIAHEDALGTRKVEVPALWLPGYAVNGDYRPEVRAFHTTDDGRTYVGLKSGLFRMEGERLVREEALGTIEVRDFAETPHALLVATKAGVWSGQDGRWTRILEGEAWSMGQRGSELAATLKHLGPMRSIDGGATWQATQALTLAVAGLPAEDTRERLTLQKLVMDLHTGQAFLGKSAEWIWIDLIGLAMAALTVTGVLVWWRARRQKLRIAASALQSPLATTSDSGVT